MTHKVDWKRWLYATVAVFIVLSILAYLTGKFLFTMLYPEMQGPGPKPEDEMMLRVWNYLGRAIFSAMLVFIYAKGYEAKPAAGQGLRYGLWIGLLLNLPGMFGQLVTTNLPIGYLLWFSLFGLVHAIICGLTAGLIYKPQEPQKA